MRLYFAYGSNMDRAHMARLCPQAEAIGPARLDHHRFVITHGGYGSIVLRRGAAVHGVLWRVSARDRAALESYESVATGLYRPAALPVHHGEKLLRALVYIANDQRPARASAGYRDMVVGAARAWALPEDYVGALERGMMAAP